MLFRKMISVMLLLLAISKVAAQKFELGKVSIAELQEKTHPKDPSAAAAVLFEKGEVRFEFSKSEGFSKVTTVQSRIKIYKKEGYEKANRSVRYYVGDYKEKIAFSDVATYNLVDGKIVKTKLKSDGEFDEKIDKYTGSKKIALPAVSEGSVIEYQYRIVSPSIGKFRDWSFQGDIPVNYSEFSTYVPEYFIYNVNQKGTIFPKAKIEKSSKSLVFTKMERSGNLSVTSNASTEKIDYEETKTTYLATDMPAMKDEAYVNNIMNYTSAISHELSGVHIPNEPYKMFSSDWDSVTKTIYNDDNFGSELDKSGYFESDINALLSGLSDRDEKINAIFNYVKATVKWNNYYGYSCDDGVKKAYKDKTGNSAEINLMLTAMLRYAGINANPVLVSTRANGISYFPNRTAFNFVIAAIEISNALILLDATDKFSSPNILPFRDLNWFGRLIRKDGSSTQVNLMPVTISKEINYLNIVLKADGSVDGKIRTQYTDYKALELRNKAATLSKDAYLEELESENNAIEVSEYSRENDMDLSKPVIEAYTFKDTKDAEVINSKIYLSPMLFLTGTENPFKQEKREYPIDYGYPSEVKYIMSIEIPEGYAIESMPSPMNLVTGDGIGTFKYYIAAAQNKIQMTITSNINEAIISADYYDILKDFYQKMVDKQKEKIVVVKNK